MTKAMGMKPLYVATGVYLVLTLALSAYAWVQLPSETQIPIHWNAAGEVDGYGSKPVALFVMPVAMSALVFLILGLTRLDPRRAHVEESRKFLIITMVSILVLAAVIHGAIIVASFGHPVPMDRIAGTLVGLLFLVIGNYLGKVRSNYFMGVRTPWTLSSELSWNKTHRLAGKLFVAAGVVTVAAAWVAGGIVALGAMLTSVFAAAIVSVVYSYVVWKGDPAVH